MRLGTEDQRSRMTGRRGVDDFIASVSEVGLHTELKLFFGSQHKRVTILDPPMTEGERDWSEREKVFREEPIPKTFHH